MTLYNVNVINLSYIISQMFA